MLALTLLQLVLLILFGAMYFTRRRDFSVFAQRKRSSSLLPRASSSADLSLSDCEDSYGSADDLLQSRFDYDSSSTLKDPPTEREVCCLFVLTPNTTRFRGNWHSRVLQKFPFLIEMFYWIINYAFYRMTAVMSQRLFAETGIWEVAQSHGIQVLEFEEFAPLVHWLFPVRELGIQQWFMSGHQDALTVLNRVYALIHIPGTVG